MSEADLRRLAIRCALGRIFRMGARPTQPGDVEEYEQCRNLILDLSEPPGEDYRPNYARDRMKGAQGD